MHRPLIAILAGALLAVPQPAQARTLTTLFAADSTCADGGVAMFHAHVLHQPGVRITAASVNCASRDRMVTVHVYVTPGHYLGAERNPAAWTLVATGRAWAAKVNTPTLVELPDFVLAQGAWGIAVSTIGTAQACSQSRDGNLIQFDGHLLLQHGATLTTPFQGGSLVPLAVWNGSLHYAASGDAVFGPFGTSCAEVSLASQGLPSVGNTLALHVIHWGGGGGQVQGWANRPPPSPPPQGLTCLAFVAFGFSKTFGAGQPLPWNMTPIGIEGCSLLVDPVAMLPVMVQNDLGIANLPIPNDPRLYWLELYSQAFLHMPGNTTLGFVATNGCEGVIGR